VEHLAIDLGKRESQICLRDERGEILKESRVDTCEIGEVLRRQSKPTRVVVETCAEAFSVADEVLEMGHEVRVVPATLAKALGVGERGIKTDRRDARALSKASVQMDLGSVHIPSQHARDLKAACGHRDVMVRTRTLLINNARGYLRTRRIRLNATTAKSFVNRTRKELQGRPEGLPLALDRVLRSIESLSELIAEADKELGMLAKADPVCSNLMSMPGVGPVTAISMRAGIDDPHRFPNGHRMQSYLGLTPGERSSSDTKRITGITKAGPSHLRWVLIQAAWSFWRSQPKDPNVLWAKALAAKRCNAVAIVALARRMSSILRAMWFSREPYRFDYAMRREQPALNR
jgi:transposase